MSAGGPVVDPVPCSGCGKLVDPLRTGHVAIFDLRFHYFCDAGRCRAAFLGTLPPEAARSEPPPPPARAPRASDEQLARVAELDAPVVSAYAPVGDADAPLPEAAPSSAEDRALAEPLARTILDDVPARHEAPEPRDVAALLLAIAIVAGALAVALALAGEAPLVVGARVVLAAVGAGMLVARATTTPRDACDPHPAPLLSGGIASIAVAAWAAFGRDRALAAEAASLAGVIVGTTAIGLWVTEAARRAVQAERAFLATELVDLPPRGPDAAPVSAEGDLAPRPGDPVTVDEGMIVPVDLTVTGPDVEVLPWPLAATPARRREGDAVVAGARVVRGRLRGVCTFVGHDRAFARLLLDPRRRADVVAAIARASRALVERWAIAAAAIGALSAFVAGRLPIEIAMAAAAVHAALSTSLAGSIAAIHVARGVVMALRRGIAYRSADAWDRAGRVGVAVFCARGTLLLGEPELAEVESLAPKLAPNDVLALAAGAERAEEHPIATAILRAARGRGVRPDGVRNPSPLPGLGVVAVSSNGEELCVGRRTLLLEQRVAIASAEQRITELEGLGRTVVLVALGGRLVGLLALQDGLRPGGRAAVQHLLDAAIEPVLMSGDSRETCDAIARSLDIDHVRPEVLPADRAQEVKRIGETGAGVAVIGHPRVDEQALSAADVAVALSAAGAPGDHAVTLASDDVRDAAIALALARRSRIEARAGLALAAVPALVGAAAVSFGILPPAYAPIASLLGGAMAALHVRALDRLRHGPA